MKAIDLGFGAFALEPERLEAVGTADIEKLREAGISEASLALYLQSKSRGRPKSEPGPRKHDQDDLA